MAFELRQTDDRTKWFISLAIDKTIAAQLDRLRETLHKNEVETKNSARELSLSTHGYHVTVFYDCDEEKGRKAVAVLNALPLDWKECKLVATPVKMGKENPLRRNSQCWAAEFTWLALDAAHALSKRLCLADERAIAEYRPWKPHITLGFVQDALSDPARAAPGPVSSARATK